MRYLLFKHCEVVNSRCPRNRYTGNEAKTNGKLGSVRNILYETQVETAVDEMKREGFRNADISVLFPYNEGTKDFALEKGTKAPEGAAAGATSGAVIGGALGWLAGIGMLAFQEWDRLSPLVPS